MSEHIQPVMHPDPDVLSAFAEGALAEHERLACLDHLAACAQCREIVYLTQATEVGDAEPAREPKPVPAPFWKKWLTPVPVLSAAAVAALVAVSILVYRPQTPPAPQPELMARAEAPPAAVSVPLEEKAAPPETARSIAVQPKASSAISPPPAATTSTAPTAPAPATPAANQLAGVSGTVTDPAGAAVPNAQVQLSGLAGANTFRSTTDTGGQYSVTGVPPGQYELRVDSPGFKRTQNEIHLQPAQVARADSVLPVGNASDAVAVSAEAASVQTSTGGGGRGGRARAALTAAPIAPKPPLLSVASGRFMLRTDASGTLSRSTNAGESWEAVKGNWQGKVVRLATPPDAPGAGDALFQLNTDTGEVWLSGDGDRWKPLATPATPAH